MTKNITMRSKILLRLLKQSAIPALVALSYTMLSHRPMTEDVEYSLLLGSFAAAFFLASWFIGQVLRTAKQVHDEERFNTIIERLDSFDANSLEAFKLAATDHIDMAADYAHLRSTVKMLVPEYIKGMVYAMHLDRGENPMSSYVKPWEVSSDVLATARNKLLAATERVHSKQE